MSSAIEGLQPDSVWKNFAAISKIPRGSKEEAAIARYVMDTAKRHGLKADQDEYGNVVVRKFAKHGREQVKSLALQGHLDMVCEKNANVKHDFAKDPIEIVRKGAVLTANGTTLGADNGIAVATNLAIMENPDLEHGPLELLFTVDEETGLTGAANLKPGFLQSRALINLDSEEEGEVFVGCAGGRNTTGTWALEYEKVEPKYAPYLLTVKGLKGGHSGLDIDQGRGNSIKILNRVLLALAELGGRLSTLNGGNKSNAIPREAEAELFLPKKKSAESQALVAHFDETIRAELSSVEPALEIHLQESTETGKGKVLPPSLQRKVCQTLSAMPHGVVKMSADISGLVETSTNLAVVRTEKKAMVVTTSQRSSVGSEMEEICQSVRSLLELGKASVDQADGYPGWKPNLESPLLKVARETYHSLFGKEAQVKAVHAGLECGIIGEKFPGMDMVSFGPTLRGVHSPDECIDIASVDRFWTFLLGILRNVA
ncbi:MAG: aminoacyl-histidine dipeptidase [Terriglobia bacterium]